MERLIDKNGDITCKNEDCFLPEEYCVCCSNFCEPIDEALNKLKHYEDLEEQGLLVRLPCKVGDTVYEASRLWKSVMRRTVVSIVLCNGARVFIRNGCGDSYEVGVDVFTTQSEAEEKLREMEKEK